MQDQMSAHPRIRRELAVLCLMAVSMVFSGCSCCSLPDPDHEPRVQSPQPAFEAPQQVTAKAPPDKAPPKSRWVCAPFKTQEEAQAAFDNDPARWRVLDGDGDGVACERLPRRSAASDSKTSATQGQGKIADNRRRRLETQRLKRAEARQMALERRLAAQAEQERRAAQRRQERLERRQERPQQGCCKICRKGCACGNSCISCNKTCHKGPGCACDG